MAYTEVSRKKSRTHVGLLPAVALGRVTLTLPTIAAHTTDSDSFRIPGVRVGDRVFMTPTSIADGLVIQLVVVTGINTVNLQILNATAAEIETADASFDYVVFRG